MRKNENWQALTMGLEAGLKAKTMEEMAARFFVGNPFVSVLRDLGYIAKKGRYYCWTQKQFDRKAWAEIKKAHTAKREAWKQKTSAKIFKESIQDIFAPTPAVDDGVQMTFSPLLSDLQDDTRRTTEDLIIELRASQVAVEIATRGYEILIQKKVI